MPCPGWCQVDHAIDVDLDGLRTHQADVSDQVSVICCDDLEKHTRTAAEVVLRPAHVATPEAARLLALEILEAGDHLVDAP